METKSFFALGYVRLLAALVMLGAIGALAAYTNYALTQAKYSFTGPTSISVQGEGEVLAKPDIGSFSFAVRAEADDAATAQERSAEAINQIIEFLKSQDVAEADIKTENYNLNPKYRYEERVCAVGVSYCPPGERVMDGFEVYQTVQVKVRDLDKSGDLISGVGDRGATNISSLQFTIDDETVLKAEARAKAIEDARTKAEQLARDLDVRLVRMIGFWEDQGRDPIYGYGGVMMESASIDSKTVPSVPVGENSITSNVNITYEIR